MSSGFSFNLYQEGTPQQHILFRPDGAEPVTVPVAGREFPTEMEPRFRALYQVLVDEGLIQNLNPVFRAD